ncbi:hypothetical protein FA13DRAFT_1712625 [Coprinellus micaceus]|uniref:Uncharacterized protein n=1 Tax=Coprinellus micaceus TaxID=71717 RepID=A0A4Y7SZD2_COPMI|nr:hypothetical protein FA13DRAFT_1712625 [Coprinellus micaceus]
MYAIVENEINTIAAPPSVHSVCPIRASAESPRPPDTNLPWRTMQAACREVSLEEGSRRSLAACRRTRILMIDLASYWLRAVREAVEEFIPTPSQLFEAFHVFHWKTPLEQPVGTSLNCFVRLYILLPNARERNADVNSTTGSLTGEAWNTDIQEQFHCQQSVKGVGMQRRCDRTPQFIEAETRNKSLNASRQEGESDMTTPYPE